jgi:hypothetical protein
MTVSGSLLIDRPQKIETLNNAGRPQLKVFPHQFSKTL